MKKIPKKTIEFFEKTARLKDHDLYEAARAWHRSVASINTLNSYTNAFVMYLDFCQVELERLPVFDDLESRRLLRKFKSWVTEKYTKKGDNYPSSSAVTIFSGIKSFIGFCVANDYINNDPSYKIGEIRTLEPKRTSSLTEHETFKMMARLSENIDKAGSPQKKYNSRMHYTFAYLLFSSGIRSESALNIKLQDFIDHRERPLIKLTTKRGHRPDHNINPDVAKVLQDWIKYRNLKNRDDYIFMTWGKKSRCGWSTMSRAMLKVANSVGIDRFTLHMSRATNISMMHYAGISGRRIQSHAGHVKYETTLRYLDRADEAKNPTAHMFSLNDILESEARK